MSVCESCGRDNARESKAGFLCPHCIISHYLDDLTEEEAEDVLETMRQYVEVYYV